MGHIESSAKGKHMALSASKKKLGKVYTSNLIAHVKALKQKEGNTHKRSRSQEISKLRVEINHIEKKNYIKDQKETKTIKHKTNKKNPNQTNK